MLILPFTQIPSNLGLNMVQEHGICRNLDEKSYLLLDHLFQQTEALALQEQRKTQLGDS